jgi:hypothetical protein
VVLSENGEIFFGDPQNGENRHVSTDRDFRTDLEINKKRLVMHEAFFMFSNAYEDASFRISPF